MISWRGWGALGLLPLLLATIVFQMSAQHGVTGRGEGPQLSAVLVLAAIGTWLLGRRLNRATPGFQNARHSLFMIPLEYYAVAPLAAGVFFAVATLLAPA